VTNISDPSLLIIGNTLVSRYLSLVNIFDSSNNYNENNNNHTKNNN